MPHRISVLGCLLFATSLCGHGLSADDPNGFQKSAGEAAAVAALREAGFQVKQAAGATEIGFGQPEWTPELWRQLGEITSLKTLRGTAKCADNAGLEVLTKLPRLETLFLNASTFDDEGFATLAKIKSLQTLALSTESIDMMQQLWTGAWPVNRAPALVKLQIQGFTDPRATYLQLAKTYRAEVDSTDLDSDPLTYAWDIRPEVVIPPGSYAGGLEKRAQRPRPCANRSSKRPNNSRSLPSATTCSSRPCSSRPTVIASI